MRRFEDRVLLSAGDLNTFLGCKHASALDRRRLEGEDLATGEADAAMRLVQKRGLEHETRFLEQLQAEGRTITEISDDLELPARVAATRQAMQAGADVIFQAALLDGQWHGFADFLLRVECPSALGSWCYEIADTKLASRAKASHAIQLALYADLLEAVQGVPPPTLRVMLGNGDEEVIRPLDVVHYTRMAARRLENFLAGQLPKTEPEPVAYCTVCDWSDRCQQEWAERSHLSLVANIRASQRAALRAAGVETVAELAALPDDRKVPGISSETLFKLRAQALLQERTRTEGKKVYELLPPSPGRGFAWLPKPNAADIHFDMEGDPLFSDGGLEYLFGMEAEERFEAFWAHDRAGEKGAFETFMDRIVAHLAAHPAAFIYHYNHYEPTALKRLAMRHATHEAELDDLLRRRRFVDLYVVVREALRIGEPGYSLKNVERFFRPARDGDVGTAVDSIVAYESYCETGDQAILDQIEAYNAIDCRSTAELHAWLLELRPSGTEWFNPVVPSGDNESPTSRQAEEAKRNALRERLLAGVAGTEVTYRLLVAELCDFHRREQKPQWWAYFDRMHRDEDDLTADAECLAGLRADGPARQDNRSFVRAYTFPAQDTKLRKGDDATNAASGERAGTIADLELEAGRLELRRGVGAGELPERLSLGPAKPLADKPLRNALRRFADSVIADDGRFAAVEGILRREPPRLRGTFSGSPILRPGESMLPGARRAASALDRSHLIIQGPPGTGKTWTSSRIAVALMQQGRRIGVTSLSHKAINNLLAGIEAAAAEAGFAFTGVKKATSGQPDQAFAGHCISTVTDASKVKDTHQLVAGTVYLFASKELEQTIDTLFVDEAGQVSLANLVAMGLAPRNIVLVGDQQQLGQPIQGAHPEATEVSVLEHLLQGAATVSPERGILLDTSYRMHPSICGWISRTMYDGRLGAHASTARQRLLMPATSDPPVAEFGLYVQFVEHDGRSQSCPEEADEAVRMWRSFIDQHWVSANGEKRRITPDDVLVVAPYNVQVNLLRRKLPADARVGTVDKFQGQEAPIVLVSMTSSSAEYLPRSIEFLFSRNRLNVAISRSQCVSVILASPRLLETTCSSVKQLKLVNMACHAASI